MLGLFLLYFIWKRYSELAFENNKSKWGYALLGIASYYIGCFAGGVIIAVIALFLGSDFIVTTNDLALGLIAMPFGVLAVWGLYKILENKWTKTPMDLDNGSLDIDLITSDSKTKE